ncbi:MAG: type II toxin-antitoxin system Phd/YefM family antitoxin [Acidimicrobiales bacterium]|nr:type II toxin-antitoxin system Phd/YefM family antitoxin [Acidimicrobiales bacterium]MCB1248240.1 type II toxin-antitoxin system Phd/YefM family antitoxin [Acidimicrobiales bacterium]
MVTVGVHEAKTNLSKLLQRVAGGEDVVITRSGVPVARLTAVHERGRRTFGQDRGRFTIPDDFDAPLPPDVLDAFDTSDA